MLSALLSPPPQQMLTCFILDLASQECCWFCTALSKLISKSPQMPSLPAPGIPLSRSSLKAIWRAKLARPQPTFRARWKNTLDYRALISARKCVQSGYSGDILELHAVTPLNNLGWNLLSILWSNKKKTKKQKKRSFRGWEGDPVGKSTCFANMSSWFRVSSSQH